MPEKVICQKKSTEKHIRVYVLRLCMKTQENAYYKRKCTHQNQDEEAYRSRKGKHNAFTCSHYLLSVRFSKTVSFQPRERKLMYATTQGTIALLPLTN